MRGKQHIAAGTLKELLRQIWGARSYGVIESQDAFLTVRAKNKKKIQQPA